MPLLPSPVSSGPAEVQEASPAGEAADGRLAALRQRGAADFDPVRFHFIEALARRTADQPGAARELLERRLADLLQAFAADLEHREAATRAAARDPGPDTEPVPPARGPLAELLDHIAAHAPAQPAQLQAMRHLRRTWSRLSADRRLSQSLALQPGNAGPLNSHHLVLRALRLMHELSPDYLNRFMSQVDVLVAAGQLLPPLAAPAQLAGAGSAARGEGRRRSGKPAATPKAGRNKKA